MNTACKQNTLTVCLVSWHLDVCLHLRDIHIYVYPWRKSRSEIPMVKFEKDHLFSLIIARHRSAAHTVKMVYCVHQKCPLSSWQIRLSYMMRVLNQLWNDHAIMSHFTLYRSQPPRIEYLSELLRWIEHMWLHVTDSASRYLGAQVSMSIV